MILTRSGSSLAMARKPLLTLAWKARLSASKRPSDETGEKSFVVLCNSNLALAETASHYASLVANLRYGADIFENGDEG